MHRRFVTIGSLTLLSVPLLLSAVRVPEIDVKVQVSVPKTAVASGSEGEAVLTLTPPSGIHINQYPPIRIVLEQSPPITFPESTVKVGLDAMPDDPEQNPFKKIDPIRLKFRVGPHASDTRVSVKGKVRYFYCVVRSGYCAPGSKDIAFSVPITAAP